MLGIENIISMYDEEIDVKLIKTKPLKPDPNRKGLWDPGEYTINIYLPNIESKKDFHLTLIHEFLHAKREILYGNGGKEEDIYFLEEYNYERNPELVDFIIDFYKLEVPKEFQ